MDFDQFDDPYRRGRPEIDGSQRRERVEQIKRARGASIFPAEFHTDPPDWRPGLKRHDEKLVETGEDAVRERLKLGPPRFTTGDERVD